MELLICSHRREKNKPKQRESGLAPLHVFSEFLLVSDGAISSLTGRREFMFVCAF